jgi:hypothetical protein
MPHQPSAIARPDRLQLEQQELAAPLEFLKGGPFEPTLKIANGRFPQHLGSAHGNVANGPAL